MNRTKFSKEGRSIAWFLLITFTWSIFQPSFVFAGGGGPSQPEVNSFTPMGASDMVDPFTGDFNYNIPLMDIEGYPLNIAYSSGVTMDQDASWVGLGWNLNAGAITRGLRGLPDDFNGDAVVKELNIKPTINVEVNASLSPEILGFNLAGGGGPSLSLSASLSYNNYNGFGVSQGIGMSFGLGKFLGGDATAGFSLSGSSENGASFAPNIGLSSKKKKNEQFDISKSASIGTAYNSRAGLQSLSYDVSVSADRKKLNDNGKRMLDDNGNDMNEASGSNALSGSYDLGLNQYSPAPQHSTVGASIALSVHLSGTIFGVDAQGNVGVSFSKNWIPEDMRVQTNQAYGYMFLDRGQRRLDALLDFNRDNDQAFSKYSVNLPSAFHTYDIFSISAQGTGGSFRPVRNDVGYVFDPMTRTFDGGVTAGFELGFGGLTDIGVDIQIPLTTTINGMWSDANYAKNVLNHTSDSPGKIVPSFSFVEASESAVQKDELMTSQFYGDKAEKLSLTGSDKNPKLNGALVQGSSTNNINRNVKADRELTNNQLYFLNRTEVEKSLGIFPYDPTAYNPLKGHHLAEITQLGKDGRRYVFALPAYNHFQEDVTFAIGDGLTSNNGIDYPNDFGGLVDYSSATYATTSSNDFGIDHYYSSTTTPAYSHAYMLSAVLSDDYIDSDNTQGPSPDDMGSYVKMSYVTVPSHKWRTPLETWKGYYNEGMRSDTKDDKASFVYGEKDLHYMQKIETKNYVAVFKTSARKDGRAAAGRHGGINPNDATSMMKLDTITLYLKKDYDLNGINANPIQQVVFKYNYKLCRNYPGNNENGTSDLNEGGKLTLTQIIFTYQNSQKMKYRSYKFDYSSNNPTYALKASDRWGSYKPNPGSGVGSEGDFNDPLSNSDFPYSEQNLVQANLNAEAWHLKTIHLPSGGEINVDYESDDYAFVQHKKAAQMFKIVGVYTNDTDYNSTGFGGSSIPQTISSNSYRNAKIIFKPNSNTDDISKMVKVGEQLYFRVLSILNPGASSDKEKTEFVSGYGIVSQVAEFTDGGQKYGVILLKGEGLQDPPASQDFSPITKQAILFGRTQLARTINTVPGITDPGDASGGEQALTDLANSIVGAFSSFQELFVGPNKPIYDLGKGTQIVVNKSWIRLTHPTGKKLGGGTRVKAIRIQDNWNDMGGAAESEYGQTYTYTLEDGLTSSGVASYEPQLGGDENPWHTAYIVNNKRRLAMDDKMYIDDPIMESQFPSPSIGYSRVVIKDIKPANVIKTGTGSVVKEFYTARDFPTIVGSTQVDTKPKNSWAPLLPKFQYLTANQGFSIELNDMHGKPKKESVYGENQTKPLSTIEYLYKSESLSLNGAENRRLTNSVSVINPDGTMATKTIGVRYDELADFRESETSSQVPKISINTNSMLFGVFFALIPTIWPGYDKTTNRFRSATMNKTVQKFGILEKVVANQDGSIVETNNLAYDANTGQVLVTQTTTNFNDKVYSLNYPAYWKYDALSQASTNILYSYKAATISSNGFATIPSQYNYFVEGDEVTVKIGSSYFKGWVVTRNQSGIRIVNKAGNPITGSDALIKVIRSGHRNKQETSMASMTSLANPVQGIATNQFSNVLNAGAIEFGQDWKTYCDCYASGATSSTNPYVLGTKGNWRPVRSFTHLAGRTLSNFDNNTNIRKDGVFTSYTPFYKLTQGKWGRSPENWTYVSEVTEFSPNGMTVETKDALGRYSSSLYGFNNMLTSAVAANSKIKEITSGSFEDFNYTNCMADGYFSKGKVGTSGTVGYIPGTSISQVHSHTGKNSLKVVANTPVIFENIIATCDNPQPCSVSLAVVNSTTMTISGGTLPYLVEFDSESSNGDAFLSAANTITYSLSTASNTNSLLITVIDASGCRIGKKVTVVSGVLTYQNITF
jgi:hypothetical protein